MASLPNYAIVQHRPATNSQEQPNWGVRAGQDGVQVGGAKFATSWPYKSAKPRVVNPRFLMVTVAPHAKFIKT
jgi:hypothetical protein